MSISRQNLSVIIVTFKSDQVIHNCIQSISDQIKIIVVDNSNDKKFKENIERKYNNVECILSPINSGMGSGNNLGLRYVKTDYAMILNPDVVLEKDTIQEIINYAKNISSFSVLAPLSADAKYPNYKIEKEDMANINDEFPFKVKSVDGYAMVLSLKEIKKLEDFQDNNFFDENFFMYLENDDFCKRLIKKNENMYIVPRSKVKHLGGKSVNYEFAHEVELSRNWHWMWSKFYFNKKHYGFLFAFFIQLPNFLSAFFKFLLYMLLNNVKKKQIYLHRVSGFVNALTGKNSFYRAKINN